MDINELLIQNLSERVAIHQRVLSQRSKNILRLWSYSLLCSILINCGPSKTEVQLKASQERERLISLKYQKKTEDLINNSKKLKSITHELSEQQWRLRAVCSDHEDHEACAPYTALNKARDTFCSDRFFVKHVDLIINSCHQGQCKQVDSAKQIDRGQYMLLTQSLPHTLVTFRANDIKLDRRDRKQIQSFIELLEGSKGYVIIVGRASKDGNWRNNVRLAVDRAESTRSYVVNQLGIDEKRVGYITYGDEKMYLTELDIKRLQGKKKRLNIKQANRSALIFSYPCFKD